MRWIRLFIIIFLITVPVILIITHGTHFISHGLKNVNWVVTLTLGVLLGIVIAALRKKHN